MYVYNTKNMCNSRIGGLLICYYAFSMTLFFVVFFMEFLDCSITVVLSHYASLIMLNDFVSKLFLTCAK